MFEPDPERKFDFTVSRSMYRPEVIETAQQRFMAEADGQSRLVAEFLVEAAFSDLAATRIIYALQQAHQDNAPNADGNAILRQMFLWESIGSFAVHMSSHAYEDILGIGSGDPTTWVPQVLK